MDGLERALRRFRMALVAFSVALALYIAVMAYLLVTGKCPG